MKLLKLSVTYCTDCPYARISYKETRGGFVAVCGRTNEAIPFSKENLIKGAIPIPTWCPLEDV